MSPSGKDGATVVEKTRFVVTNPFQRDAPKKKEFYADFTAECQGSEVKIVSISAADFIRSFRNCIQKIKEIH